MIETVLNFIYNIWSSYYYWILGVPSTILFLMATSLITSLFFNKDGTITINTNSSFFIMRRILRMPFYTFIALKGRWHLRNEEDIEDATENFVMNLWKLSGKYSKCSTSLCSLFWSLLTSFSFLLPVFLVFAAAGGTIFIVVMGIITIVNWLIIKPGIAIWAGLMLLLSAISNGYTSAKESIRKSLFESHWYKDIQQKKLERVKKENERKSISYLPIESIETEGVRTSGKSKKNLSNADKLKQMITNMHIGSSLTYNYTDHLRDILECKIRTYLNYNKNNKDMTTDFFERYLSTPLKQSIEYINSEDKKYAHLRYYDGGIEIVWETADLQWVLPVEIRQHIRAACKGSDNKDRRKSKVVFKELYEQLDLEKVILSELELAHARYFYKLNRIRLFNALKGVYNKTLCPRIEFTDPCKVKEENQSVS